MIIIFWNINSTLNQIVLSFIAIISVAIKIYLKFFTLSTIIIEFKFNVE